MTEFNISHIPEEVNYLIEHLQQMGYEAYLVGGCLRDCVLGSQPKDWDVATSALPAVIKECFSNFRVIETGIAHGTVTVIIDSVAIEVTTFRIDGNYSDNRHPDEVLFTDSIVYDLSRRDFTINAMAYNRVAGLVDPFMGITDIKGKTIRCVGDAISRFSEDALRILRALRFASVLGFTIETETSTAIDSCKDLLENISYERIVKELRGLLIGETAGDILVEYSEVISVIIPELESHFDCQNQRDELRRVTNNLPEDFILRFAALMIPLALPTEVSIKYTNSYERDISYITTLMKRLRFPAVDIGNISKLIRYGEVELRPEKTHLGKLMSFIGMTHLLGIIELQKAKALYLHQNISVFLQIEEMVLQIEAEGECYDLKMLAIDGDFLVGMGIKPGKQIAVLLDNLLEMVIDGQVENTKDDLKSQLLSLIEIGSI